jgi:hypothetical protein
MLYLCRTNYNINVYGKKVDNEAKGQPYGCTAYGK